MITIKIDENPQSALEQMNITAELADTVMTVTERGELLGVGVMELHDEYALLKGVYIKEEFDCFELEFGLAKSMLNAVDLKGIRCAVTDGIGSGRLITALRFKPSSVCGRVEKYVTNRKYYLNLDGYFTANC